MKVKARITIDGRNFVFDAAKFELDSDTAADRAAAMSATLNTFFDDVARGDLHHWSDEEEK